MARLLVQLKLRLLRNALRSSGSAKASFIVSTVFAVLVAFGVFAGLAALRGQRASVDVATGTTDEVRGGKTLQRAFIDLVGSKATGEEGLSWLGSSSS